MIKMIYILIIVVCSLILVNIVSASSEPIGYEFLDSNSVIHIWNAYGEYYFNATSGIQFSNYYNNYFTKNIFCGGYKTASDTWNYDCTDTLDYGWDIESDNLTYVNITGFRYKDVEGKEVRLGVRYWLEQHSKYLGVTVNVKNTGESDINNDLGFAWRMKDIAINTPYNDNILIDNVTYLLSEEQDMIFTDLNSSDIKIFDYKYYVRLKWDNSLNYKLKVKSEDNQVNAPVSLGINAGTLLVGQEKQTTFYWRDPYDSYPILFEGFESGWGTTVSGEACSGTDTVNIGGFTSADDNTDDYEWCASSDVDVALTGTYGLLTEDWDGGAVTNTDGIWYTFNPSTACSSGECDYIEVSVQWAEDGMDSGEYCWITEQDGAGTPSNITFVGSAQGKTHSKFIANVSSGLLSSSSISIRLMCDMNGANDEIFWDDFNITGFVETDEDTDYPQFSNFWDDNASVGGSGTGHFNVTVTNTNGTVLLEINNTNVTATNLTLNVYNASYDFTLNGTYTYQWHSWGNGTEENYNYSIERNYTVNVSAGYLNVTITSPSTDLLINQSDTFLLNATVSCVGVYGALCRTVQALARYNLTTNPDTAINTTYGAVPLFTIVSYPELTGVDITTGLQLFLPFNGSLTDYSGNNFNSTYYIRGANGYDLRLNQNSDDIWGGYDGTNYGVTFTTLGGVFDSTESDYINLGNVTLGGTSLSMCVEYATQSYALASFVKALNTNYNDFGLYLWTNQRIQFGYTGFGSANWSSSNSGAFLNDSQFHQSCIVYNDTITNISFYIDGQKHGSDIDYSIEFPISRYNMSIGKYGQQAVQYMNGTIRGAYLWNRTLSSTELLDLYQQGEYINDNKEEANSSIGLYNNQSYIGVGTNSDFNYTDDFTISAWIKTETTKGRIFSRRISGDGGYEFYLSPSGNLSLYNISAVFSAIGDITDNNWHHTVLVINGANSAFYIDGSMSGEYFNPQLSVTNTQNFIGSFKGGANFFNGSIDNLRIYNISLNQTQITELYLTEKQAINPETAPTTLEAGESWDVSWVVNATGAEGTHYLVDVLFNSTYSDVANNNTLDRQINISIIEVYNISFNITYPSTGCSEDHGCETGGCSACTYCEINATEPDSKYVNCTGQTDTVPFFTFNNTGNTSIEINWTLNASLNPALTLMYDTDNDPSDAVSVPNPPGFVTIIISLAVDAEEEIWVWGNFTLVSFANYTYNLTSNSSES